MPTLQKYYTDYTSAGSIYGNLPTDVSLDRPSANGTGTALYFMLETYDGQTVEAAYVCLLRSSGTEYCLKGNNPNLYENNISILESAFSTFDAEYTGCALTDGGNVYGCDYAPYDSEFGPSGASIYASVYKNGDIIISTLSGTGYEINGTQFHRVL